MFRLPPFKVRIAPKTKMKELSPSKRRDQQEALFRKKLKGRGAEPDRAGGQVREFAKWDRR